MGLDIHWYICENDAVTQEELLADPGEIEMYSILTYRKNPLMAGWFRDYCNNVLQVENDNCTYILVTPEMITELEELRAKELISPNLIHSQGFFWGTHEEYHWDELDEAIQAAKEAWESDPTDVVIYYHWY